MGGCCCSHRKEIELHQFSCTYEEEQLCENIRNSTAFKDNISKRYFTMEIDSMWERTLRLPDARERIAAAFTSEINWRLATIEDSCVFIPGQRRGVTKWMLIIKRNPYSGMGTVDSIAAAKSPVPLVPADPDADRVSDVCNFVKSCPGFNSWLKLELRLDTIRFEQLELERVRRQVEAHLTTDTGVCTITPLVQSPEENGMNSTGKWALVIERLLGGKWEGEKGTMYK